MSRQGFCKVDFSQTSRVADKSGVINPFMTFTKFRSLWRTVVLRFMPGHEPSKVSL